MPSLTMLRPHGFRSCRHATVRLLSLNSAGELSGKTAVITGGSSGIGAATAREMVKRGASVVVADIQKEQGQELVKELGKSAHFVTCDVTKEQDVAKAIRIAEQEYGPLDIMVNNAGIVGPTGSIRNIKRDDCDYTMAVHVTSTFLGMKYAAQTMVPQGRGVILNTTSIAGIRGGLAPVHAYTAAKFAIRGLTESLANEMAPLGIRVNSVAPGATDTPMLLGSREDLVKLSPTGNIGDPIEVANAFCYLASDKAKYVTGSTLVIDGGYLAAARPVFRDVEPRMIR